jgi:Protein of unknown function (DUF2844)
MLPMKLIRTVVYAAIAAGGLSAPAFAALGGDASSVELDRASLRGTVRVAASTEYTVHEIGTSSGLVVHEYVSPDGKVFAVSWHGPGVPDLQQVLGSYYAQFAQARAAMAPHYDHHHLVVRTPGLVVQSRGRTRDFFGRAWAPTLLPPDFSLNDLK